MWIHFKKMEPNSTDEFWKKAVTDVCLKQFVPTRLHILYSSLKPQENVERKQPVFSENSKNKNNIPNLT